MKNYVMRRGRRIEVETLPSHPKVLAKAKRKYFWARWVKLPRHWITALASSKSASTHVLAHWILLADNEDGRGTSVVTLSRSMSRGMLRATRHRAARELIELRSDHSSGWWRRHDKSPEGRDRSVERRQSNYVNCSTGETALFHRRDGTVRRWATGC